MPTRPMRQSSCASFLLLFSAANTALADAHTREEGFARPGADQEIFEQTHTSPDPDNCRSACDVRSWCKSYTYVKPLPGRPAAACLLKNQVPLPVQDACCISGVKGGTPKQPAIQPLQLEWLGWDTDKVGKPPQAQKSDGAPDHHLRLKLNLAAAQEITAIELLEADVQNQAVKGGLRWSTHDAKAEYLAAEMDGRRLNPTAVATLGSHAGDAIFDLYAHGIGQWDVHRSLVAEVWMADGHKLSRTSTLEAPPDRLLGLWQMLCQSSEPDAFEPMTISGRIQLVWLPDGSIRGYFGALPLTGTLDASGKIEGSAEDQSARVVWQGQLEKPRRGKPLHGSGGFKFERANAACLGEGSWLSR